MAADEELVKQLREVFDLCDELKCGIISVKQLRDIVRKHFGGSEEEVVRLIECLDPSGSGVVTFADFCTGVVSTLRTQQPSVVVSGPRGEGLRSSPPPDTDSAIATGSDVSRESLQDKQDSVSADGEDENYSCLGYHRPESSSSKRLTTSALASQLHRSSSSRRNSQSSDEVDLPMSIEDDVMDLNHKVQELQHQVATLTDHQVSTDQRYCRVKQENAALQDKILLLEEQLRDLEVRSEDRIQSEQNKFKEIMARCERESKLEIEQYATKLFSLQKEYMEISEESFRLKNLVERLKEEKEDLQAQLSECGAELQEARQEKRRLQEALRRERELTRAEKEDGARLLEELTQELEEQRRSAGAGSRLRSTSLLELPAQFCELQQELRRVKDENRLILETNEELSAQLLASSLQEGRTLVSQKSALSLADEFDTLTKDDMMKTLHEQKEVNVKLKSYIDGILLNILEKHPELLEVKNNF